MTQIAVVGGRSLEDDQLAILYAIGMRLTRAGYIVVSGGANGGDTAAAMGAVAGGGTPEVIVPPDYKPAFRAVRLVVIDAGPNNPAYQLAKSVMNEGQLSRPHYWHLFVRNGAVALTADGCIAWRGVSGGTDHTMRCFTSLGKPVLDLQREMQNDWVALVRGWLVKHKLKP